MGHNHDHSHGAAEAGAARLWIAFGLTAGIAIAQFVGSILTGSLALLTDTAHAFVDASGLLIAVFAASIANRPATATRTWGFRRVEVIAALAQATILFGVGVYAVFEALRRFAEPPEVPGIQLLVFGAIGLVANIVSMAVLFSGRESSFNMRAAFLEVVSDALGSIGVIVAALVIHITGYQRADAIAGLLIAALILPRAVVLMRDTTRVLMEFAPEGLDLDDVRRHIMELDHVLDVHDVHASMVDSGLPVLSAHVVVSDECFADGHAAQLLKSVRECVATHFDVAILHSTFQIETQEIANSEDADVRHR